MRRAPTINLEKTGDVEEEEESEESEGIYHCVDLLLMYLQKAHEAKRDASRP